MEKREKRKGEMSAQQTRVQRGWQRRAEGDVSGDNNDHDNVDDDDDDVDGGRRRETARTTDERERKTWCTESIPLESFFFVYRVLKQCKLVLVMYVMRLIK